MQRLQNLTLVAMKDGDQRILRAACAASITAFLWFSYSTGWCANQFFRRWEKIGCIVVTHFAEPPTPASIVYTIHLPSRDTINIRWYPSAWACASDYSASKKPRSASSIMIKRMPFPIAVSSITKCITHYITLYLEMFG